MAEDVRAGLEARWDVHLPGVVVADEHVGRPSAGGGAVRGDQDGSGVVDLGPLEFGFVDGGAPVAGAFAGREVGEYGAWVVHGPSGPGDGDVVAGADDGVGGDGFGVAMAGHVGGEVVGEVDPAIVGGVVRPGDAVGEVRLVGARVVAFVFEAIDVDVGDVGVRGREGGEA